MSKEVKIIECEKCHRELYRLETGKMLNDNGVWGMNIHHYAVGPENCPECAKAVRYE